MDTRVWYEDDWVSESSNFKEIENEAKSRCLKFFGTLDDVSISLDIKKRTTLTTDVSYNVELQAEVHRASF